ncbi:MAG: hypothetical protein ACD_2C00233G0001, partial [uncultured bacterium (gcode 4)]
LSSQFSSLSSSEANALGWTWTNVYISWNYNWVMLKVFTWSTYYFVPTPTLFWLNPNWTWNVVYDNTFWSWKDLLPWVNNVAIFDSSKVYSTWSDNLWSTEINDLMTTMQEAYATWNITTPAVQAIVNASWAELINIWNWLVKNSLWGWVSWGWSWWEEAIVPNRWDTSWNAGVNCNSIKTAFPSSEDWTYWIKPTSDPAFQAYCDMESEWWWWTLVLRWKWANGSDYISSWNTPNDVNLQYSAWVTDLFKFSDSKLNSIRNGWVYMLKWEGWYNTTRYVKSDCNYSHTLTTSPVWDCSRTYSDLSWNWLKQGNTTANWWCPQLKWITDAVCGIMNFYFVTNHDLSAVAWAIWNDSNWYSYSNDSNWSFSMWVR